MCGAGVERMDKGVFGDRCVLRGDGARLVMRGGLAGVWRRGWLWLVRLRIAMWCVDRARSFRLEVRGCLPCICLECRVPWGRADDFASGVLVE